MPARCFLWFTVVLFAYAGLALSAGVVEVLLPAELPVEPPIVPFDVSELADTVSMSAAEIF